MAALNVRSALFSLVAASPLLLLLPSAGAHCQVPCGIYDDPARFTAMLEDATTITKAIAQIDALAGAHDAQSANQLVRWVTTKEEHATQVQRTIADYFMAQRIKSTDPAYGPKLIAAHKVMTAAMKAKQSADPASGQALRDAVLDFHKAYTGKAYQAPHTH